MNLEETVDCVIEQEVWIKVEEEEHAVAGGEEEEEEKGIQDNYSFSPTTTTTPYSCNVCTKSFTNKYGLTRHLRTHVDANKYKCLTCGRFFNDKSNLIQHERIHTGEKRYYDFY